jgi:hypothetical protein
MILTYKKDFPWKKWPKFARFRNKILAIARFLLSVPVGSQKHRKILILSYFHINTCDQIWLNHFQDDSHLSYITKLGKQTLTSSGRTLPSTSFPIWGLAPLCGT